MPQPPPPPPPPQPPYALLTLHIRQAARLALSQALPEASFSPMVLEVEKGSTSHRFHASRYLKDTPRSLSSLCFFSLSQLFHSSPCSRLLWAA